MRHQTKAALSQVGKSKRKKIINSTLYCLLLRIRAPKNY